MGRSYEPIFIYTRIININK